MCTWTGLDETFAPLREWKQHDTLSCLLHMLQLSHQERSCRGVGLGSSTLRTVFSALELLCYVPEGIDLVATTRTAEDNLP
jgi:hypothetical protein